MYSCSHQIRKKSSFLSFTVLIFLKNFYRNAFFLSHHVCHFDLQIILSFFFSHRIKRISIFLFSFQRLIDFCFTELKIDLIANPRSFEKFQKQKKFTIIFTPPHSTCVYWQKKLNIISILLRCFYTNSYKPKPFAYSTSSTSISFTEYFCFGWQKKGIPKQKTKINVSRCRWWIENYKENLKKIRNKRFVCYAKMEFKKKIHKQCIQTASGLSKENRNE